jgi:uncharacterized membrane protein YdbT with pleckstrin-like domain
LTHDDRVFAIERPHRNLLKIYVVRALLTGPGLVAVLPYLYFRYHTMRFRFDAEGIAMSWGLLFRREVNLAYARIQDIHLASGPVQRWLGLADIHIQTAAGSAAAEMKLEGLLEFEVVRDFLYQRMRGTRGATEPEARADDLGGAGGDDLTETLHSIRDELRAAREALEQLAGDGRADV